MSKYLQAYFRNEDEAEGARASLMAFQADDVEVGRLSDSIARSDLTALAFYPMSNNGFIVGTGPATLSAQGLYHLVDMEDGEVRGGQNEIDADQENTVRDDALDDVAAGEMDRFQYTLSTKVSDDQYENIVHKLRSLGAYIESTDI
ncbi:hypothetical protein RE628_22470 [Paenibacillus sp. D2_2]|uniref:hypothetical protein n=1 Tax=Paenibacillus sp. D2_2 TaxID=3073092 RepID=UPI0028153053|nr:hypothetical protein [Paenibacillus sp. D2_2]WMT40053.1 hypothetical protein RE628_22470 [Paenibacillus sp. D2_2]